MCFISAHLHFPTAGTGHKPRGVIDMTTDPKTDPKTLYASLAAGDLLKVPFRPPLTKEGTTFLMTVLRVDDQGGIYLSRFSSDHPASTANARCNPFRWSDETDTLVDCDGEVPFWYTTKVALEHGGAKEAAAQYAAVPRAEHLRHQISGADSEAFKDGPNAKVISAINLNGEAGNLLDRTSLVFDVLGIPHTPEQLLGVAFHLFLQIQPGLRVTLVPLGLDSDDPSAKDNPPTH